MHVRSCALSEMYSYACDVSRPGVLLDVVSSCRLPMGLKRGEREESGGESRGLAEFP
jgi:hypothetical protein